MFCLKYYPSQKYLEEVDELKIKYRPSDPTLKDFLDAYKQKSIVIDVVDSIDVLDIDFFKILYKSYQNFRLIIPFQKDFLEKIQEAQIPFFFSNYVGTIDELYGLMKYNPTDMYICEELGFNLEKISAILHEHNIKVRVFPNICQSSFPETESMKTFFIRPEDIFIYSHFVDIFELISDKDRQQIIYKIYKQQKWFGPIKEIIPSFKNDLDSKYIIDSFGIIRSKCGKRCLYTPNSCNICDRFIELSETLEDGKIVIRHRKKKN